VPGDGVDRLDLTAEALRHAGVEQDEVVKALLELVRLDRVAPAWMRRELLRLGPFLARSQRPEPAVELEHRAIVVAVVAQQPPEPFRPAHRAVGDDKDAVPDPGPSGCLGEQLLAR